MMTKKVKTIVEIMTAKKGLRVSKIAQMKAKVTKLEEDVEGQRTQTEDQDRGLRQQSITRTMETVESSIAHKKVTTPPIVTGLVHVKQTEVLDLKEMVQLTEMAYLYPTSQDLWCSITNL